MIGNESVRQKQIIDWDFPMLTVSDVAKRLKLSRQCVYAVIESGELPAHRFGVGRGTIRVAESDLRAYVSRCRNEKTEEPAKKTPRPRLKHIKV